MLEGTSNFGIGVDIESMDRFAGLDRTEDKAFLNRVFTQGELEYCFSKRTAAVHLAARYAGKEAVVKALTSLGRASLGYGEIEILNNDSGVPVVRIYRPGFDDLQVRLSLSHCKDKAIAFTIIIQGKRNPLG